MSAPQLPSEMDYPEEYYEHLARILGEERAEWARLPPEERLKQLRWVHEHLDAPDDLDSPGPEGILRLMESASIIDA